MKKLTKRIAAVALGLGLAVSALTGCSSAVKTEDYSTTVVATLGDENIYLDEAVMYLRMDQNYYEMMYTYFYGTTDIWDMEIQTGLTMEDNLKTMEMQMLRQMYILCSHADELGVTLSDADLALAEEAVDEMRESSAEEFLESIGMDRDRMVEAYQRNALANLVYQAVIDQVDTEVSEDEIRCVGATYVKASIKEDTTEEGSTEEDAEALTPEETIQAIYEAVQGGLKLDVAAEEYGLTPTAQTYFVGDTYEEGSLGAAAISMAEGEMQMMEIENDGWYLLVLDSLRDETATENKKESVIAARQTALFEETYAQWQEASPEFKVVEKVWNAVPMTAVYAVPTAAATEADTEAAGESTVSAGEEETEAPETAAGETEAAETNQE